MGPEAVNLALLFEPDGYLISGRRLMGRHSAGRGFLTALLAGLHPDLPIFAYTPKESSARVLATILSRSKPKRKMVWIKGSDVQKLQIPGAMYVPGPSLGAPARMRQRIGSNAYSLIGVTHTTATHRAMDAIADLVTAPIMPWDALVCTSSSVRRMVVEVLEAEIDYLRGRLGATAFTLPQLPVIPLGIHTAEFDFGRPQRRTARRRLGIEPSELVVLSVGRFNFTSKMNPYQMYSALGAVAKATSRPIRLVQCGWFSDRRTEEVLRRAAAEYAEGVKLTWLDGRREDHRRLAWASGDIFVSLADNIQETFGLTPLEAMATGMPVVAADWDGYRETVRDGIDGCLIPTTMPAPGFGARLASQHEAGDRDYEQYCSAVAQTTSVDMRRLVAALVGLCENDQLRGRMGKAGHRRAREEFDWASLLPRYLALSGELAAMRAHGDADRPRPPPARQDPFHLFAGYPTTAVSGRSEVRRPQSWSAKTLADPLFSFNASDFLDAESTNRLLSAIPDDVFVPIEICAKAARVSVEAAVLSICRLAKAGGVIIKPINATAEGRFPADFPAPCTSSRDASKRNIHEPEPSTTH